MKAPKNLDDALGIAHLTQPPSRTGPYSDPELFTPADLEAHIGAVLEQAAKACEAEVDFPLDDWDKGRNCGYRGAADDIRALRPDALQALERVRREARVEALIWAEDACAYNDDCLAAIRALIEAERGKP